MTVISILSAEWEILLDDELNQNGGGASPPTAGMRTVQHITGTTVITTNVLYSAVAEAMDDFIVMGFRNAMRPTTPNAYTMESQYFIPRESTEFLREGAITAEWALTSLPDTNGNGVLKKPYAILSGDSDFIATDIGRQITEATSGDTGILLDFDIDPDGTPIAWIRPDDSTPTTGDIFDSTSGVLSVTADTGGAAPVGTVEAVAVATSGTTQYSAIQAIGSVPTATEVYLVQDRLKITDSAGGFQWWATDPAVSLGIISILIRVKDMDDGAGSSEIADGDVEVFSRRYTSLYDNFRLNVLAGGFSALPLASAVDINNTTGYRSIALTGGSGTWDVGNGIYEGATFATASARGVITGGTLTGGTPTIEYYIIGSDNPTLIANDLAGAIATTEYDFSTAGDGDAAATGGAAPIVNLTGPTDPASGEGGTVTLALGGFLVDHTGDGVNEPYSVQVNAQNNVAIAKVYERLKYVTRRGADEADLFGTAGQYGPLWDASAPDIDAPNNEIDIASHEYTDGDKVLYEQNAGGAPTGLTDGQTYFVKNVAAGSIALYDVFSDSVTPPTATDNRVALTADGTGGSVHTLTRFVNIPGESYRGLDSVTEYDTPTGGDMTEGENIFTTTASSTWTGRLLHQNTTNSPTYFTITDQQTSVDALANNDVIEDAAGAQQVLVAVTSLGINNFTSPKSSPLGTFTGSTIFGARGVSFINFNAGEDQDYILTDDLGTLNSPPNSVSVIVTNALALDRILVARDNGTDGIIDKDIYGGIDTPTASVNTVGNVTIQVGGTIPAASTAGSETPASGYIRVVENTLRQEHHYVYDTLTRGLNGQYDLRTASSFAGTTTAGTGATILEDTGQTFQAHNVEVGMLIRVITGGGAGEFYEVTAVTDEDTLGIVQLYGTSGGFVSGDTYEINKLIQTYAVTDNLYDLILDIEATTTSHSNTIIYSGTSFDVVVNVRQGKLILPFTQNQLVDGAVTVTVVRQPDTIAT